MFTFFIKPCPYIVNRIHTTCCRVCVMVLLWGIQSSLLLLFKDLIKYAFFHVEVWNFYSTHYQLNYVKLIQNFCIKKYCFLILIGTFFKITQVLFVWDTFYNMFFLIVLLNENICSVNNLWKFEVNTQWVLRKSTSFIKKINLRNHASKFLVHISPIGSFKWVIVASLIESIAMSSEWVPVC